jgi:hypothetical protein
MRYTFPQYTSKEECVIPDLGAWQSLKEGMSRGEVIQLLGEPPIDPLRGGPSDWTKGHLSYGWLDLPHVPHPRTYTFLLWFDQDEVFHIESPFGEAVSKDGIPSKPEIISPEDGAEFDHYPRIIDIRWSPAAGDYPMRYEVELGIGDESGENFQDKIIESDLVGLFLCIGFPGAQAGRVRVRGANQRGTGQWSDYHHFECLR